MPGSIPADTPSRALTLANTAGTGDPAYVAIGGNVYTILVSGKDTEGRYCLMDMPVAPMTGPPPHRHDFEEMFTLLEGEIDFTFRGATVTAKTGDTINVPANAPHSFRNNGQVPARMLCLCAPAGQDEYFRLVGDILPSRDAPLPKLTEAELAQRRAKAEALAADYKTEFLKPE